MVFVSKLIAAVIAWAVWIIVVLPIWVFMLFREICVSSFLQVGSAFSEKKSANVSERLNSVAKFWPDGFSRIGSILDESSENSGLPVVGMERLFMETILAIFFYSSFFWITSLIFIVSRFLDKHMQTTYGEAVQFFGTYLPNWVASWIPLIILVALIFVFIGWCRK